MQWRSKALRGPGSTVTWGPSLSPGLHFPHPPPSPPLPLTYPSSSSAQPLPCREAAPQFQLGGLGSAVSSPSGVWGGAPAEIEFCAFYALCSLLLVFRSSPIIFLPKFFLWPTTRGPQELGAPVH